MIYIEDEARDIFDKATQKYEKYFKDDFPVQNWEGWEQAGIITKKDAEVLAKEIDKMIADDDPLPPLDPNILY
ncbi:hypothetical protein [Companilactobacillus furfuricola]|uniref:hypothetical protein n=1 Tax=Companilactobacillus furfuricola TaxID=1462575 RepID=UPI000F78A415|nr:hypothetical protein [Companilactobacillus furfuricola]